MNIPPHNSESTLPCECSTCNQTLAGVQIRFVRRRYGHKTFTWLHYRQGDSWLTYNDPWPIQNIPTNEVQMAVARIKGYPLCGYHAQDGERWHCVRPAYHRGDHSPFLIDAQEADGIQ